MPKLKERIAGKPCGSYNFLWGKQKSVFNPVLTKETAMELKRRLFGDGRRRYPFVSGRSIEERNKMVVDNFGLVWSVAWHFRDWIVGVPALDIEDLAQEGGIGLIKAAERFRVQNGFKFSTYACWWIQQNIRIAIQNQKDMIRLPIYVRNAYNKIIGAQKILEAVHANPTIKEIAKAASLPVKLVRNLVIRFDLIKTVSLDELISENIGEGMNRAAITEDKLNLKPEQVTMGKDELRNAYQEIQAVRKKLASLKRLSSRSRLVFEYRYGLDGIFKVRTLEVISRCFDFSRERVRQIVDAVFVKLNRNGARLSHNDLEEMFCKIHQLRDLVGEEAPENITKH